MQEEVFSIIKKKKKKNPKKKKKLFNVLPKSYVVEKILDRKR